METATPPWSTAVGVPVVPKSPAPQNVNQSDIRMTREKRRESFCHQEILPLKWRKNVSEEKNTFLTSGLIEIK